MRDTTRALFMTVCVLVLLLAGCGGASTPTSTTAPPSALAPTSLGLATVTSTSEPSSTSLATATNTSEPSQTPIPNTAAPSTATITTTTPNPANWPTYHRDNA